MRSTLFLLPLLLGCPKKPAATAVVDTAPVYPDLHCPQGTTPTGLPPPDGLEVWCIKVDATGQPIRQGPAITWYANEQRKSEGDYVSGHKSGAWSSWYPTGKAQSQGSYIRGTEDGFWTTFHPNGERKSEGQMVDGKEHGKWTYWSEDLARTEGNWVLGQRDGEWTDFDADGVAVQLRVYRNGRMINLRDLRPPPPKPDTSSKPKPASE